jgi:hypothetical protein
MSVAEGVPLEGWTRGTGDPCRGISDESCPSGAVGGLDPGHWRPAQGMK